MKLGKLRAEPLDSGPDHLFSCLCKCTHQPPQLQPFMGPRGKAILTVSQLLNEHDLDLGRQAHSKDEGMDLLDNV